MALAVAPLGVSLNNQFLRLCAIEHNRKNWLFSDTPKGAEASSLVYTMVEMAKANDLNVYKYLEFLLAHRPNEAMTDEQLEDLAPWSIKAKASCQI